MASVAKTCSIDHCELPAKARALCNTHYQRWFRTGVATARDMAPEMRFWEQVDKSGSCWLWTGATFRGYGRIFLTVNGKGFTTGVHRYAYKLLVGDLPDDLQLDHTCHSTAVALGLCAGGETCLHRACVNPDHLEPVTAKVNTRRGNTIQRANLSKTHCNHGHEYTEENTYRVKGRNGSDARQCKTCRRLRKTGQLTQPLSRQLSLSE